jgi:hypothetical protein
MSNQEELSTAEERIQNAENPFWLNSTQVRVCLVQLREAQLSSETGVARREELLFDALWDGEDYDEVKLGVRPEGTDPKADVAVCGMGGCTLRVFQTLAGGEIETGECKAEGYCLKEKFEAVTMTPTVDEGKALFEEILNTCEPVPGGSLCPNLSCSLAAGVSEDGIPGTDGVCAKPYVRSPDR